MYFFTCVLPLTGTNHVLHQDLSRMLVVTILDDIAQNKAWLHVTSCLLNLKVPYTTVLHGGYGFVVLSFFLQ